MEKTNKAAPNPRGRPKGSKNRTTMELQELARQYGPEAIKNLANIALKSPSQAIQVMATKELLDRGYGKASQAVSISGPEGRDLIPPAIVVKLVSAAANQDDGEDQ